MRLRVLHVEGMPRPLMVIDRVGLITPAQADDVFMADDVNLPQLERER